jgi:DNA-binding response OmpR family regulator
MFDRPGVPAPRRGKGRGSVLVVEDEFLVALDLERQLLELGCEVMGPVASMRDARALVAAGAPDLVLLDVALLDGRSAPLAVELRRAGIPFLLITGYGEGHLEDEIFRDAARLDKPCDAGALHAVLGQLLPT